MATKVLSANQPNSNANHNTIVGCLCQFDKKSKILTGFSIEIGFNIITRSISDDIKLNNEYVHNSHIHAVIEVEKGNNGNLTFIIHDNIPHINKGDIWNPNKVLITPNDEFRILEISNTGTQTDRKYFEWNDKTSLNTNSKTLIKTEKKGFFASLFGKKESINLKNPNERNQYNKPSFHNFVSVNNNECSLENPSVILENNYVIKIGNENFIIKNDIDFGAF
ncbi:hypothetical protein KAZ01_00450 [Candidatus Gracilibacteria bacterium]|nr:hypothetical protein [Candidatus Gracilibacteria bacterium]